MDILFDNVIFSKEKQGGISNYWYELIKQYANSKNTFFFEEKGAGENIFRCKLNLQNIVSHYQLPLTLARLLPIGYQSKADNLLYHSSFYRKLITTAKVCEVTTIHDFLHHKHSAPLNRILHNTLKFASIKRSRGIICVSNNTLLDLKKFCKLKKHQKITVIYNGVSKDYKPIVKDDKEFHLRFSNLNIDEKFLLFVGARSNYKNFAFVLRLLEELKEYKLVVVGNVLTDAEKSTINRRLLDRIVVANSISNNDLNLLYNYAHALLYPSSYEGFGIPVIEAMKAGCPVFALNSTAIPEVAGNAAMLYNDLNTADFVKGIKRLEDTDQRTELVRAGFENSKRFDWAKCIKETTEFYEEVYDSYL